MFLSFSKQDFENSAYPTSDERCKDFQSVRKSLQQLLDSSDESQLHEPWNKIKNNYIYICDFNKSVNYHTFLCFL